MADDIRIRMFTSTPLIWFCLVQLILLATDCHAVDQPPPYMPQPQFRGADGELEDMEFRVAIDPGQVECFYQEAKQDHQLEVSYQVIEQTSRFGWVAPVGRGDLKIDFQLYGPGGELIVAEQTKDEGSHVHTVQKAGTFRLCLDNSRSSTATKMVQVEVYLYSNDGVDGDRWGYNNEAFTFPPQVQALESIEAIKTSINKVRDDLTRVVRAQDMWRAIERRDRSIAEENFDYVNRFSIASIILIALIGCLQILMIRSLFEEKSALKNMFKTLNSYVNN